MMVCPFKMVSGFIIDAQRSRIHVAGRPESAKAELDLGCIGPPCMLYMTTGKDKHGVPTGACSPAVNVSLTNSLVLIGKANAESVQRLEEKLDAVVGKLAAENGWKFVNPNRKGFWARQWALFRLRLGWRPKLTAASDEARP